MNDLLNWDPDFRLARTLPAQAMGPYYRALMKLDSGGDYRLAALRETVLIRIPKDA